MIYKALLNFIKNRQKKHLMKWGYSCIRLPFGITALSLCNDEEEIILLSRHPRWSITWLWSLSYRPDFGFKFRSQRAMRRKK